MRTLLVALVLAAMLSLFGSAALQAAGDIWPGGGALPPTIYMAGDIWPGGGALPPTIYMAGDIWPGGG